MFYVSVFFAGLGVLSFKRVLGFKSFLGWRFILCLVKGDMGFFGLYFVGFLCGVVGIFQIVIPIFYFSYLHGYFLVHFATLLHRWFSFSFVFSLHFLLLIFMLCSLTDG